MEVEVVGFRSDLEEAVGGIDFADYTNSGLNLTDEDAIVAGAIDMVDID